jgi:hypothetical protein
VLELLPQFYDVVLLDLGTGLVDDLALFGIRRAEQALIVTEPKFVTTEKVLDALPYIESKGCWDGAGDGARLERPADARPRAALAVERPVTMPMRLAVDGPRDGATTFIDVTAFDRLADNCGEYLSQGRAVAVSGRLTYSEWEADDGSKRSKHEIVANQVASSRAAGRGLLLCQADHGCWGSARDAGCRRSGRLDTGQ